MQVLLFVHPGLHMLELTGIRDVDWGVELGAFAEFWPLQNVRGRIDLRHGDLHLEVFLADRI